MTKVSPTSVIMLTLNEEENLPGAIENTKKWAQEIFVVDSLSTDSTVDIALAAGAHVVQRPFTNFGDQWNFALECLPVETPWTMKLDPDERLSEALIEEIHRMQTLPKPCTGYSIRRRLWFMGKPMHVIGWVLRLWRTGSCHFSDVLVNEHPIIDGDVGELEGIIEHLDSPNLYRWFEKQNRYSTMEAIMKAKGDALAAEPKLLGSALERRMFLKKVFFKIPFRYQLLWIYEAIRRGAYRDGYVGLAWARLRVEHKRNIEFKAREMEISGDIPEPPRAPKGDFDPRIVDSPLQKYAMEKDEERTQRNSATQG